MSTEKKALILTWVGIGILIAGAIGFYLGRNTTPNRQGPQDNQQQLEQPGTGPSLPPPQGGQQPGGRQNLPPSGVQPPPQE